CAHQEILNGYLLLAGLKLLRAADWSEQLANDTGLLFDLAHRGFRRALARLDVALGKHPDVRILLRPDQKDGHAIIIVAHDEAARLGYASGHVIPAVVPCWTKPACLCVPRRAAGTRPRRDTRC